MNSSAITPVKLKKIMLFYENGNVLVVPEKKTLEVGTAFVKCIKDEELEWEVQNVHKMNIFQYFLNFFKL